MKLNILKNIVKVMVSDTFDTLHNTGKTLVNRSKMRYKAFKEYAEWQSAINAEKDAMKRKIDQQWSDAEQTALDALHRDLSAISK